jgi:hypothetical protein
LKDLVGGSGIAEGFFSVLILPLIRKILNFPTNHSNMTRSTPKSLTTPRLPELEKRGPPKFY